MNQNDMSRRLRSWMVDAGWTLEETAEKLGVKPGALKGWVYGQRRLPLDRACQICDLFGKPLDEHSGRDADALAEAREQGADEAVRPVLDRPIPEGTSMPLWLQDDPQWSGYPYAGGTISDKGCGLVCAAMAVKYMTVQDVTPPMLADAVGTSCITDGVNDPGKFCTWIAEHYPEYGIEHSGILHRIDDALAQVDAGWLAFAGMSGRLGEREYEGHVVLIWRGDVGTYWIRDPASGTNSQRAWTREELEGVEWKYFYTIRGGFYGN